MCESITAETPKQDHQKPPRSLSRITGEILAGTAMGLVIVLLPVAYGLVANSDGDCFGVGKLIAAVTGFLIIPPVYALANVLGVYLVGSRGNQTGSVLATLGGAFVGVLVMYLLFVSIFMVGDMMLEIEKIVLWPLAVFAVPIIATLGFNMTRRYKRQK